MTDLYPAIDLRGGRVVRLVEGDYSAETAYSDDPVDTAVAFAAAGAPWIHVVDLDAARTGDPVNRPIITAIAGALAGQAQLQTGGGVRSEADAATLATAGVARVVMGSAAVADPPLVDRVAQILPVAVGLDHRSGEVAVHGWTSASGLQLADALGRFPAAAAFVITDISRDGRLEGPDLEGLAIARAATSTPIIASGGVATLADIRALAALGVDGVITGKALYERRFTVADAVGVLAGAA